MSEPKTLTPEQISGLKELAGKATPGPWYQESWKQPKPPCEGATELSRLLCCFADEPAPRFWNWHTDGEFVASSREAVPALIEMVEGLTEKGAAHDVAAEARDAAGFLGTVADCIRWLDHDRTSAERRAGELEEERDKLLERCEGYKGQVKAGSEEIERLKGTLNYLLGEKSELHPMFGGCPTIRDLCFSIFMHAKLGKNAEDGGEVDWANDTAPIVEKAIEKIRARAVLEQSS